MNSRQCHPRRPSTLSASSVSLHLCGVLAADTVQVQGDTGELQFSFQFKFHRKEHNSNGLLNFPDAYIPENGTFRDSLSSSPPSSYLTPTSTRESQDHNADANAASEEYWSRGAIVTRLRSGVLSPVKYYPDGISRGSLSSEKKRKASKGRGKGDNIFDKLLKRRNFPLRPCNSYAFFVMANWGVVRCCSFEETSKRLSKQWYRLPHNIKKEYEDMALKDNARYKRQCMLLSKDAEQESSSGLLADSN